MALSSIFMAGLRSELDGREGDVAGEQEPLAAVVLDEDIGQGRVVFEDAVDVETGMAGHERHICRAERIPVPGEGGGDAHAPVAGVADAASRASRLICATSRRSCVRVTSPGSKPAPSGVGSAPR